MESIIMIKIVFGIILSLSSFILILLAYLLFYKYFYGAGADANRRCAVAIDVIWWQQFIITDVWIWSGPECTYSQRPTIICQRELVL